MSTHNNADPDPWRNRTREAGRGGPAFGEFIEAVRLLQDRVTGARPPDDEVAALAARVQTLADELLPWQVSEWDAAVGTRQDLPGRGNPLLPPLIIDEWTAQRVVGRVVFRRFYIGGNGAAHGGTLPLLFDEVLGKLSNSGDRTVSRTAFLTVNYRRITRIGVEHTIVAEVARVEGRKRWLTARLYDEDRNVTADAEGLFLELKPGQP